MKKPLKIAFLLRLWPVYGGGETVTICLANEMVRRGHDVFVFYFRDNKTIAATIPIDPRIKAIQIVEGINFDEFCGEMFVSSRTSKQVNLALKRYVFSESIDIIINQWWPSQFCRKNFLGEHVKIIKCWHNDVDAKSVRVGADWKSVAYKYAKPIFRFLERKKRLMQIGLHLSNSDRLLFLSKSYVDKYIKMGGKNNVKLNWINNPLVFPAAQLNECLQSKDKSFLYVGRLVEEQKQVFRLLNAWTIFQTDHRGSDWRLDIVGDGPDRKQYEDYVLRHGLTNVVFYGFKNPLSFYSRSPIFLMTSAYEGFSMTLIEAQQNGTVPIVMDSFSSLTDIVEDGVNGVIVPDGDTYGFAEKMLELASDKDQWLLLADMSIKMCNRFSVDAIVDRWEGVFSELID